MPNALSRASVIVELVGPTGSGKSTVSNALRGRGPDFVGPLTSANFAVSRLLVARQMAGVILRHSLLWIRAGSTVQRNIRRLYALQKSLAALSLLPRGINVVDEGPIHGLMSSRIATRSEANFWRAYADEAIEQIASKCENLIVAKITVDDAVRLERRRLRDAPQDRTSSLLNARDVVELSSSLEKAFPYGFITAHVQEALEKKMMGRVRFIEIRNNFDEPDLSNLFAALHDLRGI